MAQMSLFFTSAQFASLILCFRRRRVAGGTGSLVFALAWVLCLPLIAALTRVAEPAFQSKPFILWIFFILDS